MKKYILKRDLPLAKEGTIVRLEDTPVESSIKLIFEVNKSEHPLCAIHEKELNEWIEEIPEKSKSIWNLKQGDDFYFIFNNSVRQNFITNCEPFIIYHLAEGNVFLTKEEAEKELNKKRAIQRIKKYCYENNIELADGEYILNKGNHKKIIEYLPSNNQFIVADTTWIIINSFLTFKKSLDAQKVIDNCEADLRIIFDV